MPRARLQQPQRSRTARKSRKSRKSRRSQTARKSRRSRKSRKAFRGGESNDDEEEEDEGTRRAAKRVKIDPTLSLLQECSAFMRDHDFFELYRVWGYGKDGHGHSGFEDETHSSTVNLTMFQAVTDYFMRLLSAIDVDEVHGTSRFEYDSKTLSSRFLEYLTERQHKRGKQGEFNFPFIFPGEQNAEAYTDILSRYLDTSATVNGEQKTVNEVLKQLSSIRSENKFVEYFTTGAENILLFFNLLNAKSGARQHLVVNMNFITQDLLGSLFPEDG